MDTTSNFLSYFTVLLFHLLLQGPITFPILSHGTSLPVKERGGVGVRARGNPEGEKKGWEGEGRADHTLLLIARQLLSVVQSIFL